MQAISLMHGLKLSSNKQVFRTIENIIETVLKDDAAKYLLFLKKMNRLCWKKSGRRSKSLHRSATGRIKCCSYKE